MGQQTVHTNQNKNVQSYATAATKLQVPGNSPGQVPQKNQTHTGLPEERTSQRQNHANEWTYAGAAAAANNLPGGLNHDNTRYHHSHNNCGRPTQNENQDPAQSRENNNNNKREDKQPKTVRNDYLDIDPVTKNVKIVKDFKTIPYRSEKQRQRENRKHKKNMDDVLKEAILFDIPTRDQNGDIASKASDMEHVVRILKELKRGGFTVKDGDVVNTVPQWKTPGSHTDHNNFQYPRC